MRVFHENRDRIYSYFQILKLKYPIRACVLQQMHALVDL